MEERGDLPDRSHTDAGGNAARFRIRTLIRSVYAPTLLHAVGQGMMFLATPLYAQELGASEWLIGLIVTLRGLGAMACDVPAGLLAARFGGRVAMSVGAIASGAGALALALSDTPAELAIAIPLVGAGLAAWMTSRLAYVTDLVPAAQRGRALALIGGSNRIGMAIGPVIGGAAASVFGLEAAFIGHALAATLALLLVATARTRGAAGLRALEPPIHPLATLRDNRRAFASAGSVAVVLVMVRSTRQLLMPLWGVALGLDPLQIGLVIGLASAVDMLLFYPVGWVMDRWGRKWTIVPCLLTLSAALALVPLTTTFGTFLAVGLLGGLGNGLGSGAVMTLGADLAPPQRSGSFLGVWRLLSDSGQVSAPILVGAVADALSLGSGFLTGAGLGLGGALVMARAVPEGLPRAEPQRPGTPR